MAQRRRRPDTLYDLTAAQAVRELRSCRTMLIQLILSRLRPSSPLAEESLVLLASIDRLADRITGIPGYFVAGGSCPGQQAPQDREEWRRWEAGDMPPT